MRLKERAISAAMLLNAASTFEIIEPYPDDKYLPSYLVRAEWSGAVFHAQIATDVEGDNVRVVTMYMPKQEEWSVDFRSGGGIDEVPRVWRGARATSYGFAV